MGNLDRPPWPQPVQLASVSAVRRVPSRARPACDRVLPAVLPRGTLLWDDAGGRRGRLQLRADDRPWRPDLYGDARRRAQPWAAAGRLLRPAGRRARAGADDHRLDP